MFWLNKTFSQDFLNYSLTDLMYKVYTGSPNLYILYKLV